MLCKWRLKYSETWFTWNFQDKPIKAKHRRVVAGNWEEMGIRKYEVICKVTRMFWNQSWQSLIITWQSQHRHVLKPQLACVKVLKMEMCEVHELHLNLKCGTKLARNVRLALEIARSRVHKLFCRLLVYGEADLCSHGLRLLDDSDVSNINSKPAKRRTK